MPLVPYQSEEYVIFVSSGDDAIRFRDLVQGLVEDALTPVLLESTFPVRLQVDRWERSAPGRVEEGESVNDRFVRRALRSQVTLCLLINRLGQGTREEIEAVLNEGSVELSVIWFVDRNDDWPQNRLGRFLKTHRSRIVIDRAGPPEGDAAVVALVRALFQIVVRALSRPSDEGFRERRAVP